MRLSFLKAEVIQMTLWIGQLVYRSGGAFLEYRCQKTERELTDDELTEYTPQ